MRASCDSHVLAKVNLCILFCGCSYVGAKYALAGTTPREQGVVDMVCEGVEVRRMHVLAWDSSGPSHGCDIFWDDSDSLMCHYHDAP